MPNPDTRFTLDEFNIQGKALGLNTNSQNFDVILLPSTNKIVMLSKMLIPPKQTCLHLV